jgi:D-lyxose ketol-isomerase
MLEMFSAVVFGVVVKEVSKAGTDLTDFLFTSAPENGCKADRQPRTFLTYPELLMAVLTFG